MRYEDEKKEVRLEKIHTWDLLVEVDKLLEHVSTWKPFNFQNDVKQLKIGRKKNKRIYWNKKGN